MSAQEELVQADESAVDGGQAETGGGFSANVTGKSVASGKLTSAKKKKNILKFSATAVITLGIVLFLFLFLGGNYIPDAILTRFVEETDVQYADAVQSKELVFQNAMENGKIPENTARKLEQAGVIVGYMDGDTFVASNISPAILATENDNIYFRDGSGTGGLPSNVVDRLEQDGVTVEYSSGDQSLVLNMGDKIITAKDFYKEVNQNVELYDAFTQATYGRAAYYYDEKAQQVFKKIGTSRNNFSENESFEETVDKLLGDKNTAGFDDRTWHWWPAEWGIDPSTGEVWVERWDPKEDKFECTGSNITAIDTWQQPIVSYHAPTKEGEEGYYYISGYDVISEDYGCNGTNANTYMKSISQANMSEGDSKQTIYNTADSLKTADTVSKEQKSMLLYSGFMESISRMKAGYGKATTETDKILAVFGTFGATYGESKINDVMNALFETKTTKVIDVETGQEVELTGSMLEAPSVYAILAGEKVNLSDVANFSSDRILYTIENTEGGEISNDTIKRTLITKKGENSKLGRYTTIARNYTPSGEQIITERGQNFNHGNYESSSLDAVELTIDNSLYKTFSELEGITAGELLAEGAVNVGKELAKASGAAAGGEKEVTSYLKLNSEILALDAEVDRMHRSPLDITSKNTFLGSLVYKFAVSSIKSGTLLNKVALLSKITNKAVASILPSVYAEEESDAYLSTFGNCRTLELIGATGSPTCSMIATFDTTTYEGIYQNADFQNYISKNLDCDNGNCKVVENSDLAMYVNYNEERTTPIGMSDAGIMEQYTEQKKNEDGTVVGRVVGKIGSFFAKLFGLSQKADSDPSLIPDEATGKAFVDSSKNENWNDKAQYKYAQRYISLARAAETMRQYDGDETAYVFEGFGTGDPIARYINELNQDEIANN